jgi:cytoskeleton protein RodZ
MNGIGGRLQAARERANLSLLQAAEKLHVDPGVIHALETERFGDLGAAVYIRGHLRHYAELVRESAPELLALYADSVQVGPPPDLTQMPHAKQDSSLRGALVMTGLALVIGVGLVGSIHMIYLDLHPAVVAAAGIAMASAPATVHTPAPRAAAPAPAQALPPQVTPARMADGVPRPPAAPSARPAKAVHAAVAQASVTLKFKSACWTEVHDGRGAQLFRAIGEAGEVANLRGAAPLKVIVGNLAVVDIEIDGHAQVVPAEAQTGRTAEFLVTLTGGLEPVRTVTTAGNKP